MIMKFNFENLYSPLGGNTMQYTHHYTSPLGGILLASDGKALTGLWFDGQKYFGSTLSAQHEQKMLPVFEETVRWLDIYFGGQKPNFTPSLSLQQASSFRREVWEIMLTIPFGQTMTYKAIAAELAGKLLHGQLKYIVLGHLSRENNYPELAYETMRQKILSAWKYPLPQPEILVANREKPSEMLYLS